MSDEATTTGKSYLTPFNIVAGIIVIIGLFITILRFTQGLGAVTNLSDYNPWGIWIGFDLLVGVVCQGALDRVAHPRRAHSAPAFGMPRQRGLAAVRL